jgi:repressor LexA
MSPRQPLTARQQEALDLIAESLAVRGYPPTLREIGERMGIRSTNGVNDHLKALERKGYLAREDLKSRALRPTDRRPSSTIRVLGQDKPVEFDRLLLAGCDDVIAIVARNGAMLLAGVLDGGIVFVRTDATATLDSVVVVMTEAGPTCQRFSSDLLVPIIGVVIGTYLRLP